MLHINDLIKLVFATVASLLGLAVFVSNVAALPAWLTVFALVCITVSSCLFLKQLLSPARASDLSDSEDQHPLINLFPL